MATAEWKALIEQEQEQERRNRELIATGFAADPWGAALHAVTVHQTDEVPRVLYRMWEAGDLTGEQLHAGIHAAWVYNEAPIRSIGERRWLRLFKAAGFVSAVVAESADTNSSDGTRKVIEQRFELITECPTKPVTVWRGADLERSGRGMSWSLHRECAHDFARRVADRYRRPAAVYRAELPPRAVLGVFGDEREQELVVNPNMLRGRVELIEEIPRPAGGKP